jgi:hypothetical protein
MDLKESTLMYPIIATDLDGTLLNNDLLSRQAGIIAM